MIICVGDSLTFGNVGCSYRKYLTTAHTVNKGFNGDPLMGIYKRLLRILKNPRYAKAQTYIIGGGTNDILLPALKHHSLFWKLFNTARPAVMGYRYCCNSQSFQYMYEKIILLLLKHHKKIVLIGIPKSEVGNLPLNDTIQSRNLIIQELAQKYNLPYINVYELISSLQKKPVHTYNWGKTIAMRLFDATLMTLFPFSKDLLSRIRHLCATVDGIHYNSSTARQLARMIELKLK